MIPIFSGMSAPVTTATTPGYASARLVSTRRIRACGRVDRRRRPYSIRGRKRSSAYRAWPVRCAHELTFGRRRPITENSDTQRRLFDRLVDRGVARAAAEVPADRVRDLITCWSSRRVEQRLRRHEHPGRAVTALRSALFRERDLKRVQRLACREPLDRRHVAVADECREGETREHRKAVDEDGARAAFAELAAVLRAGEPKLLAKHLEQGVMRIRCDGVRLALHAQGQELRAHAPAAPLRRESARAADRQRSPMRRNVRSSTRSLKPTTITTAIRRPRASTIGAAAARTPAKSSWSSYPISSRPPRILPWAPLSIGSRRPSGAVICRSVAGSARPAISRVPSTTIPRIAVSPKLSISDTR